MVRHVHPAAWQPRRQLREFRHPRPQSRRPREGGDPANFNSDSIFKQPRQNVPSRQSAWGSQNPRASRARGVPRSRFKKARGDGAPQGATSLLSRSAWPCEGHVPRSAHRLAALHRRCGPVQELHPRRADMHRRRTARCHPLRRSFQAEDPRRFGTGCGHWRQGQSGASSALSRRVLRSAPCRKQQLLVMGAGGSPRSPGRLVCVTSRAGAALHSALKNASGQRPSRMKQ